MGRKSTKANKNVFQLSREETFPSRAAASEKIHISPDRIARIENDESLPHPDEVLAMAEGYNNFSLCNHYCSNICEIGKQIVPEVELKDISQITLEMLVSLNSLYKEKERLAEITVDGKITEDELIDFERIQEQLSQISLVADSLNLWFKQTKFEKTSK